MMESEKTRCRKPLWLGVLSLALVVMPFLAGLLGFFWKLFCLASIIIGMLAMITGSSSKSKIGILLGGIGVVVSVLLFLLMSFVVLANISGARSHYLWQMQTLSSAIQKYCEQNEETLPDAEAWCDQLLKSVENVEGFSIDTFQSGSYIEYGSDAVKKTGYAFNKNLDSCRLPEIVRPTVLLFETDFFWNQNGTSVILESGGHPGYWPFYARGYHFVLVGPDSTFTVKFVKNSELDSLNWTPVK